MQEKRIDVVLCAGINHRYLGVCTLKTGKKRLTTKTILAMFVLFPLVVVAEYFFILIFAKQYSDLYAGPVLFPALVGGAITLISLYLWYRESQKTKRSRAQESAHVSFPS